MLERNFPTITEEEQECIKSASVGVVGVGGVGAVVCEILTRIGVEKITIVDKDIYKESNRNRQLHSTINTLGMRKVDVIESQLKKINQKMEVNSYFMDIREDLNVLKECEIVVDASDNLKTRKEVSKACKENGKPYVFCSAGGSRGMVSIMINKEVSEIFSNVKEKEGERSVIAPAAWMTGVLSASQAINYLIGKPTILAPKFIFFDLFKKKIMWVEELR